jgi:hypothetical protein
MEEIESEFTKAVSQTDDVVRQLQLAVEAHALYHARHRFEAFVGTREIASLTEPIQRRVITQREQYEQGFRELIERGSAEGQFKTGSPRLVSFAILDMGIGIAVWFKEGGPFSDEDIARHHGLMALRMVGYS